MCANRRLGERTCAGLVEWEWEWGCGTWARVCRAGSAAGTTRRAECGNGHVRMHVDHVARAPARPPTRALFPRRLVDDHLVASSLALFRSGRIFAARNTYT